MPGASDALGERFRAAREARGLSLSDVAEQIRIRTVYLSAIEDENWKAIGAPVYVRGFLRTYARFLGIDPEEAVAAFNGAQPATASAAGAAATERQAPETGARRGSTLVWVAAAVAVLLIAFVVYNELTMRRGETAANVSQSGAGPTATEAPSAAATSLPTAQLAATPPGGMPDARSLALVLSEPSWLRVTVDGNVSMEGTFPAGTSKTFHGRSALVRIGNAGGVEIFVDGRDRGKLGKPGDVVEQTFTL